MKNKKFVLISGLLVALLVVGVIGVLGVRSVYAQTPPTTPVPGNQAGPGFRHDHGL